MIALQTVLEQPDKVDGLIISGSHLYNAVAVPCLLLSLAGVLSRFFPGLPVQKLDTRSLSRDEAVVRAYEADSLVYNGRVKARLGAELLAAGPYVMARAGSIHLPVLIMHGGADQLASPEGSRDLYARLGSADKTLKIYDGYYHEIFIAVYRIDEGRSC